MIETTEDTLKLKERIYKQIHDLRASLCDINDKKVSVMIDEMIDNDR